jgi:extracellular ribonuclease
MMKKWKEKIIISFNDFMGVIMKRVLLFAVLASLTLISCGGNTNLPSDKPTESTQDSVTTTAPNSESDTEGSVSSVKPDSSVSTEKPSEPMEDIPEYYRNKVDFSLTGAALKTDLFKLISKHTDVGYSGLYNVYKKSDIRPDGTVWDMYSNKKFYYGSGTCGNYSQEGDCYNREHTIPQSVFNKRSPMRSDAFHVVPTDGKVNGMRSNYPHAEVSNPTYTSSNGSMLGTSTASGYSGKAFEPIDEYKGDFARIYFYFVTCYEDKMSSMENYACFARNTYPSLSKWAINLYLKWAEEDPVSQKEIDRNNAVYSFQNNRNPYVDFPGLEKKVWGNY